MMDRLADRLGLDPVEVRQRNLVATGSVSVPDADRRALRQRRLPGRLRQGAGAGALRRAAARAGEGARRGPLRRDRARAGRRPVGVEHGLRRHGARSAVPREARVLAEVRRRRRGDDQDRPARARHRDPGHDAAGPGPPDGGVADRRRRAWAGAPGRHGRRRDGHVHARVVDLVGNLLEPLRLRGHERRRPGRAQAQGQARRLRRAPDGAAGGLARVSRRRRAAAEPARARRTRSRTWPAARTGTPSPARGHGARAPGDRGVRLHGREGRRRRGPGELVEHVRVHRRGDGGGGRSRRPRRSRSCATSPCTTRARSSIR